MMDLDRYLEDGTVFTAKARRLVSLRLLVPKQAIESDIFLSAGINKQNSIEQKPQLCLVIPYTFHSLSLILLFRNQEKQTPAWQEKPRGPAM